MKFASTAVGFDLERERAQFIIEHGVPELFTVGGRDGIPLWYVVTIAEQPHDVQRSMLAAGVQVSQPEPEQLVCADDVIDSITRYSREERARIRAALDAADLAEQKPTGVLFPEVASEIVTEKRMEPTDEEFQSFWEAYPRHVDKKRAKTAFARAFKSLRKTLSPEQAIKTIMDGVTVYAKHVKPDAICHPTTWLNGDRWEDDPSGIGQNDRASRSADNAMLGAYEERERTPISEAVF